MSLVSRFARFLLCLALTALLVMPVAATVSVGPDTRVLAYAPLVVVVAVPAAFVLAEHVEVASPRVWRTLLVFVATGLAFGVLGTAALNALTITGLARDVLVLAPTYAVTYLAGWRDRTPW